MATPLTDSINALTQYANETTGKQDTTLSDAVGSLVEGYGGSGWLPASAELVASADETLNLSADTSWDSITPSTTQQTILTTGAVRGACSYTLTVDEAINKAVIAVASARIKPVYTTVPDNAYPLSLDAFTIGYACLLDLTDWSNNCINMPGVVSRETFIDSSGIKRVTDGSIYYGIVFGSPQFVGTNPLSMTPIYGFTRQSIFVRCNTNIFSTDSAALIDSANTNIDYKYRIYLIDKADSIQYACFDAINGILK